jgi:hypothetical protein
MATELDVNRFMADLYAPSDLTAIVYSREAFRLALENFERESISYKTLADIKEMLDNRLDSENPNNLIHIIHMIHSMVEKAVK